MNPIVYGILWLFTFTILFIGALFCLAWIGAFFGWIKDQFTIRKYQKYQKWLKLRLRLDEFYTERQAVANKKQRVVDAKLSKKKQSDLKSIRHLEFKTNIKQ